MRDVPPSGWGPRPVTYTARGKAEADAFQTWSTADNPRLRCRPTSIIFDWVFDGAVNRITQEQDRIVINYGLYSFERVIHMNMTQHPANITPSYAGHSIGRWEGDVLVVDTVGFEPGVIAAPVRNSEQLHIVERFSLDAAEVGADARLRRRRIPSISRTSTSAATRCSSPTCRAWRTLQRARAGVPAGRRAALELLERRAVSFEECARRGRRCRAERRRCAADRRCHRSAATVLSTCRIEAYMLLSRRGGALVVVPLQVVDVGEQQQASVRARR